MFDDLEDVDDVCVDPKSADSFVKQLLSAAEAGDATRERGLLGALDDGLEAAAASVAAGGASAARGLGDWLALLLGSVEAVAKQDAALSLFAWEAPGRERCGAALVRRLWRVCASAEFDRVQVDSAGAGARGVVLMLGDAGASFADMAAPAKWWREQRYTCVQAVRFGVRRLMMRQVDRILQALLEQDVAGLGLVVHVFSEHGHYFWGHVMQRWQQTPPAGLPPLKDSLRGCIYDSCSSHACVVGEKDLKQAAATFAKETLLSSVRRVSQRVLLGGRGQDFDCSDTGLVCAGIMKAYDPGVRGLRDDPIFDDFHKDWHAKALQEPPQLQRLVIYSAGDPVAPAHQIEQTCEWIKTELGQRVEMLRLDGASHCAHRADEGAYFGRLASWLGRLAAGLAAGEPAPAGSSAAASKGAKGYDEEELARKGWLLQTKVPGDGRTFPQKGSEVALSYKGFLPDGTEFDSSPSMGCSIGVGKVIKAWDEAVLEMSLMQEARLICYHTHAYGEKGDPFGFPPIPPKATLTFEVKLLRIG